MYPIFETSDADNAFPTANNIPKKEDIPEEFWKSGMDNKYYSFISEWFYGGARGERLVPREGVDKAKAVNAIRSIIGSFSPSHEHKFAACTFLLTEWFSDVKPKEENENDKKI